MRRSDRIAAIVVAGLFALVVGGMTYLLAPRPASGRQATTVFAEEPLP